MKKIVIGILIGLLICGIGFGVWKVLDNKENNEKISEEKLNELYSMVKDAKLYYKEKVTTSSNQLPLIKFALNNYIKENNINKHNFIFNDNNIYIIGEDDTLIKVDPKNYSEKDGIINKTKFYNYVKEKYNITLSDISINNFSLISGELMAVNTSEDFIICRHGSTGSVEELHVKLINYEEDKDYVYIYDNAIIKIFDSGSLYLEKYFDATKEDMTFYCSDKSNCGDLKELTTNEIMNAMDNNKFKHTFKKNKDNTYSYVSSEHVM